MMVLSTYAKQRILLYSDKGKRAPTIQKKLGEEGIAVSRISIWKFLRQYTVSQCLSRKEGSGRPTKLTPEVMRIVEGKMSEDDETTAYQLHKILKDQGFIISITTHIKNTQCIFETKK